MHAKVCIKLGWMPVYVSAKKIKRLFTFAPCFCVGKDVITCNVHFIVSVQSCVLSMDTC